VKLAAYVLFAVVLAALQASFLRHVGGGAFSVALLAACLVYLGLHGGNVDGAVAAAGVGYVLDLIQGTPKGLMTFLAVLLFVVVRGTCSAVEVRGRTAFAIAAGAGTLFLSLGAFVMLRWISAPETDPGATLLPRMLLEAVLTAIVAPLVHLGMRRIDRLFTKEEHGLLR
jgi:rod shape-determining protein MreD